MQDSTPLPPQQPPDLNTTSTQQELLLSPARNTTLASPIPLHMGQRVIPMVVLPAQLVPGPQSVVSHEPIGFFRDWFRRIQEQSKEATSGKAFVKYCETVPCPLDPLVYSEQTTYSEVVAKVVEYKSLFSSPHSVMVLQEHQLYTVYVGAAMEKWDEKHRSNQWQHWSWVRPRTFLQA